MKIEFEMVASNPRTPDRLDRIHLDTTKPPFDGKPVLIQTGKGWCEAYWMPQEGEGEDVEGFCFVVADDALPDEGLDDVSEWAPLPTSSEPDRTDAGQDGSTRKAHYGDGRQPWDDIVDAGWGAPFAAGNVLKYLRRDKDREASLDKARWYFDQLTKLSHSDRSGFGMKCMGQLCELLTEEEVGKASNDSRY